MATAAGSDVSSHRMPDRVDSFRAAIQTALGSFEVTDADRYVLAFFRLRNE